MSQPKRQRRLCKFTEELAKEFPFIKKAKTETDVTCQKCLSFFSIGSGGRRDITRHLSSEKHKKMVSAAASSSSVTTHFRNKEFGTKEANLAASEALFSFHTVAHNHSFRSMDCTSKIIQKRFENKFTSSRTKSEAIVKKVLAPYAVSELLKELEKVHYISIFSDASNHKDIKLFPTLVRYFSLEFGICVKIMDFVSLPGETSEVITNSLIETLKKNKLEDKLAAYCADNANTNFGGVSRKGIKNVYHKLNENLNQNIIGIGCAAHIIHNTIKTAADLLPVDVETVVEKIYFHFYIFTVRVETLKNFCDEAGVEYNKILNSSKTRWLALMPAIERIIKLFQPLKSYFLSLEKCPVYISNFFSNETSEMWLKFMHCQSSLFYQTVKIVEDNKSTAVQVSSEINKLILKLQARKDEHFLPLIIRDDLRKLCEDGQINREWFLNHVNMFYQNCLDYLNLWSAQFKEINCFEWTELKNVPEWNAVQSCISFMSERFPTHIIDENLLFDEVTYLKKYVTDEKITGWDNRNVPLELKWLEVFNFFKEQHIPFRNILKAVEFSLCLPGTNAPTERTFSVMNNIWTNEKSQLGVETLKAMLMVRCNIANTCEEFLLKIEKNYDLLKRVHSAEKYL